MKKFLLSLGLLSSVLFALESNAQCTGGPGACTITTSGVSSVATKVETVGSTCVTTANVTINLGHNGGLKWVPIYFYDGSIPAGVCGTTPSASSNPLAFVLLEYMGSNIFQVSSTPVNSIAPQNGYTITSSPITGGTKINIIGLKITKPGACATSQIAVYIGAENSAGPGVKCYASGSITTYQLRVSGKVDCSGPRNYDLILDTDFETLGSPSSLGGTYNVYIDSDNDGVVDPGETQITSGASFSTSGTSPLNRFTSFDNTYSFSNGDPRTAANLVVEVIPSSATVASMTGRLFNSCGTLPVSMKSFDVKKQTGKVSLIWETADETNNKGFEVQRRLNNGQFETVAFIPAKAINGGGATYSYDDQSLLPDGSIYYRLRQVDNDDQSRFSDIRLIHNNTRKLNVSVYPNPSNGAATLILPEAAGSMDITIEDYTGRTIQRWTSYNSNNLQINQLRPGIYMIRVQSKETGEQTIQRLMVQ